jgi:CheY-like chemotaxis protein
MKTVLVVDDEVAIAEALSDILSDEGYRTLVAVNGQHGLTSALESSPDLILVDMMMPVMDGPTMIAALRENPMTAEIPVVGMSALGPPPEADRLGYHHFLEKPFDIDRLLGVVQRVIGPSRAR